MSISLHFLKHDAISATGKVPLVIVHGLFGSSRNWWGLSKRFATDRDVYIVDLRNHGSSPWDDTMTYTAMADDLALFIKQHCQGEACLLGHSMGGKAVMTLALLQSRQQELSLPGMIVADIAPIAYTHSFGGMLQAMKGLDVSQLSKRSEASALLESAIPNSAERAFLLQNLAIDADRTIHWKPNLEAIEKALPAIAGWPDAVIGDAVYNRETLFIYGQQSTYLTPSHHHAIAGYFPLAHYAPIADASHWLHAQQPDAFAAAVTGYLMSL